MVVQDLIQRAIVSMVYVPTKYQLVDLLTVNGSDFHGKIGLWRTGHYEIAKKKSKNRDARVSG